MIASMRLTDLMSNTCIVRERMTAHVRQRRGHHRQVATGDENRALPEVHVERVLGLVVHEAEIEQQVRDGAIAVAGPALGLEHRLVDVQTTSGGGAQPLQQRVERLARRTASAAAP